MNKPTQKTARLAKKQQRWLLSNLAAALHLKWIKSSDFDLEYWAKTGGNHTQKLLHINQEQCS